LVKPVLGIVEGGAAWFDWAHHRLRAGGFGSVGAGKKYSPAISYYSGRFLAGLTRKRRTV
jgi:hypothetical protein